MATIVGIVSSSKKKAGSQTINGYVDDTSAGFCAGGASSVTVYSDVYSSIAAAYSNNSTIYSDSGLTTAASAGYYGDTSGGPRQTNYYWNGRGWSGSNIC